jgi:hypothetical protein
VAAGLEAGLGGAGLGALVCGGGGEGGFFTLCALERNAQAKSMDSGIRVLPTRERVLVAFMMSPLSSNSTLGTFIAGKDGTKTFHKSYGRMEGIGAAQQMGAGNWGTDGLSFRARRGGRNRFTSLYLLYFFPLSHWKTRGRSLPAARAFKARRRPISSADVNCPSRYSKRT